MIKKIIALSLCAVSLTQAVHLEINRGGGQVIPLAQYSNVAVLNTTLRLLVTSPLRIIITSVDQNGRAVRKSIYSRLFKSREFNQLTDGDIIDVY